MFLNSNAERIRCATRGMSWREKWRRASVAEIIHYLAARALAVFLLLWVIDEVLGHSGMLRF